MAAPTPAPAVGFFSLSARATVRSLTGDGGGGGGGGGDDDGGEGGGGEGGGGDGAGVLDPGKCNGMMGRVRGTLLEEGCRGCGLSPPPLVATPAVVGGLAMWLTNEKRMTSAGNPSPASHTHTARAFTQRSGECSALSGVGAVLAR